MKLKHFFSFIAVIILFASCSDKTPEIFPPVSRTEYALGTIVSVKVTELDEETANSAIDKAFLRLYEIEYMAGVTNPDGELSYLNRHAYAEDVKVSDELFSLIDTGLYYSRLTDGAFDIGLGALTELWGIGSARQVSEPPDEEIIAYTLENSGFENIVVNYSDNSVHFLTPDLKIDLGGIAKGYAADEMKRVLVENGVTEGVIDLGGDIMTIGDNGEKGWLTGITDPLSPNQICAKLRISNQAIVTSGNYERYFVYDDKKYHHIFDRETGYPADSGIISATIIADSAMTADILSTAFFVMGAEKAVKFAAEFFPEIDYILISEDMNYICSGGLIIEH